MMPTLQSMAVELLQTRGFRLLSGSSLDFLQMPICASASGLTLIAVGSCRCIAYIKHQGRMQAMAASRTSRLFNKPDAAATLIANTIDPDLARVRLPVERGPQLRVSV